MDFPSDKIKSFLESVVAELYRYNWQPRVIRQQKQYTYSTLSYIDYAIPCFELAASLTNVKYDSESIARDIIKYIEDDPKQHFGEYKKILSVESLGGYINVQLSDDYILYGLQLANEWIKNPRILHHTEAKPKFLIFGFDTIYSNNMDSESRSIYYLKSLWDTLLDSVDAYYLLEDNSEKLVSFCVNDLLHNGDDIEIDEKSVGTIYMKKLKQVKKAIRNEGTKKILKYIANIRSQRSDYIKSLLILNGLDEEKIIGESSLSLAVDNYLDDIKQTAVFTNNIIEDDANRAIYLLSVNNALSLRSSEGFLYHESYILFIYHKLLLEAYQSKSSLIVVAPQSFHSRLCEYSSLIRQVTKKHVNVVYFDPKISRADIKEFENIYNFKGDYTEISQVLDDLKESFSKDLVNRMDIIEYITIPTELSRILRENNIPAIFDTLSQIVLLRSRRLSQAHMNITTH